MCAISMINVIKPKNANYKFYNVPLSIEYVFIKITVVKSHKQLHQTF